jgi:hypothetical protein
VPELLLVKLADRLIEIFQKSEASWADARLHNAAVIRLAGARYQAAFFHPIEQAGHVRVVGNHPFADAAAGEALRLGTAENAEDVVLRAGEAVGLKKLLGLKAEGVGGSEKRNEEAVLEGKYGGEFRAPVHQPTIVVMTTNVKRR